MQDQIINWNNVYLQAIRVNGGAPTPIARAGAMMHAAMYDAVNAIEKTHQPYLPGLLVPSGPISRKVAAVHAARDVLSNIYPAQITFFDQELNKSITEIGIAQTLPEFMNGKTLGKQAAAAIIQNRLNDNSNNNTPYIPGNQPGDWRPTGSGNAATPNWGKVIPFRMPANWQTQFRPTRPGGFILKTQLLASKEYAAQLNEVKRLGAFDSTERTREQTEIALFWANDLDGTSKPPGQLHTITQIVSMQRGLSFSENARLFALVSLALGDASIVAWDAKYETDIDLWRPESAIQLADTDGNSGTTVDPTWQPLSPRNNGTRFSPNFPAYVSGHATFGAAHSGIMRNFFGTDNITFTATTEDPHAMDAYNVPLTRTFNSFTEAALENARSRVYLGVHYQWDADNGFLSGTKLADFIFANTLQKVI
jgi:hypothetical protein